METLTFKGRGVIGGKVTAEALVCENSISSFGGIVPETGVICDYNCSKKGQSFKGKILVLPGAKGSNGWSCYFTSAHMAGAGPKAMVMTKVDSSSGVAIACMKVPTVVGFDKDFDPVDHIQDGDIVTVDGDNGIVTVERKSSL